MPVRFVSREDWGAKRPKATTKRDPSTLAGVAVHWFGKPSAAKSHGGCADLLQSVQRGHMAGEFLDIAYNHAVCPHGTAYTLRGFGVETGANGTADANDTFASVVWMAGKGDPPPTNEVLQLLAEIIRMWRAKGAGPLIRPHQHFVGTNCPGPDLLKWVQKKPSPLKGPATAARIAAKDETPDWLIDFIEWRLVQRAKGVARPKGIPKAIPATAWEAAVRMDRMATELGPRSTFLDWAEWRRRGAKKAERPPGLPEPIPASWRQSFKRLEQMFTGKLPPRPKPKPVPPPPPPVAPTRITAKTSLMAEPRATQAKLTQAMLGRDHGSYTAANVRGIVKKYVTLSEAVGLDPLLVVSQMIHETDNLDSFWSQPPRRNPAGIGVTGKKGEGVSFASWDKAVRAHVGRLLAYTLPKGTENAAQRVLIAEALKARSLPPNRFGCAPTLAGLTGTWATDKDYAGKVAGIANRVRPL
jgi:Mannosyl-glycoprotein endo-beta-N-acetylglucosaminidase